MGNKMFKGKQAQSQNQNYNSNSQEQEYDESSSYQQNNSSIKGNQSITRLNIKPDDAQK